MKAKRILILGGGFGGVYTARTGARANQDEDGGCSGAQLGADHDHGYMVPGPAESQQTAGFSHATGGGA